MPDLLCNTYTNTVIWLTQGRQDCPGNRGFCHCKLWLWFHRSQARWVPSEASCSNRNVRGLWRHFSTGGGQFSKQCICFFSIMLCFACTQTRHVLLARRRLVYCEHSILSLCHHTFAPPKTSGKSSSRKQQRLTACAWSFIRPKTNCWCQVYEYYVIACNYFVLRVCVSVCVYLCELCECGCGCECMWMYMPIFTCYNVVS